MKIFIDKITTLRSECEKLEKEGYKTKGREFEGREYKGRDVSKIVFEKEIESRVDRLLYGFAAFLLTAGTLFIGLASEKVRDLWDRAFSGKKITQITFPKAFDRRVQKVFEQKSVPPQKLATTPNLQDVVHKHPNLQSSKIPVPKRTQETLEQLKINIESDSKTTALSLGEGELKALAQAIAKNTHITALYLSNATQEDLEALSELLMGNETITHLTLVDTQIDGEALAKALSKSKALKILKIVETPLGDKGAIALFKELNHHPNLKAIAFNQTGIGDATIHAMIESGFLAKTKAFRVELDDNQISDVGAIALAKEVSFLRHTPVLERRFLLLDLKNNPIGDEGALAIDLIDLLVGSTNDVRVHFD